MKILERFLLNSLLVVLISGAGWPIAMTGGTYEMTKDLYGAGGPAVVPTIDSTDFSIASAAGEPLAGDSLSDPADSLSPGYFGGRFGNSQTFQLLSSQVGQTGTKTFFQNHLQVGVPVDA